jgi:hypothetical protein
MHTLYNAIPFKLYNSLPRTLYYAIQDTTNNGYAFSAIQAYDTIETELETATNINVSIVADLPHAGQEIPLHAITIASPKSAANLKTYQTTKGAIRILPQTDTITHEQSDITAVTHHDIWLTKTTYKPAYIPQEIVQTQNITSTETLDFTITTSDNTTQNNGAIQEQPQVSMEISASLQENTVISSSTTLVESTAQATTEARVTDVSMQGTELHP